tara:strand:- start:166 stop:426 length:261 start_codon:yes stop_codon:yes gene_type:complete
MEYWSYKNNRLTNTKMKKLLLILIALPIIGFGQINLDLKSETAIENYLNSSNIDALEGIWYFTVGDIGKKLAIIMTLMHVLMMVLV